MATDILQKKLLNTLKLIYMNEKAYKIIGGEFNVDLNSLKYNQIDHEVFGGLYKYSTGRSALYYILIDIKERYNIHKILLPDYLCSSIITAAEKAEMQIKHYELDENLEINKNHFSNIYEKDCAILIINYFGLQNSTNQVTYIRSINAEAVIIEDDVQAYYEFLKDLNGTNYKFTSLRKTFACPDGGLVKTNNYMPSASSINRFHQYKFAASILKTIQKPEYYDDDIYLQFFTKGESLINEEILSGGSNLTEIIIQNTNIEQLANTRKANSKFIVKGLNSLGIKTIIPIESEKTPLFIPIYLKDRNKVRKYLFQHNVFCPIHWPIDGMKVKKGAEMAEHELSLIIDQRYTVKDMEFILNLISDNIRYIR